MRLRGAGAPRNMSTWYRTATDRAFQIIEEDLPAQEIRYEYSGLDDKLTRPFCEHLLEVGKAYTRAEIEKMDNGQLPNVFLTGGGWNCRHQWILDTSSFIEMKPEEGVHYKAVASDLSREKTGQVLSALNRREVLDVLRGNPIEKIAIGRSGGKQISGEYDWRRKTIVINSARKLGVQYGAEFQPGRTYSMSAATSDKMESLRRTLLQETAHHIENSVQGVSKVVRVAFANPAKEPITQYAGVNAEEYFAESFVTYMVDPKALDDHDPIGSRMIVQALVLTRKPK